MRKRWLFLFCLTLLTQTSLSGAQDLFLQKALAAVEQNKLPTADFWMARYLASGPIDAETLKKFLQKRKLRPGPFLSDQYDAGFIDWFEATTYAHWKGDKAQESVRTFEVASASQGDTFVTVTGAPKLEQWYVGGSKPRTLLLAMVSGKDKPMLYAGKLISGAPTVIFPLVHMEVGRKSLQAVWKPEFADLDGDKISEIWLRYNLAQSEGFSQVLEIYRIVDGSSLELIKRFEGKHEGIARRLADGTVEVLTGAPSKPSLTHRSYDRHVAETYAFEQGEFRKVSKKTLPHILRGETWKKYYL